MVEYVLKASPSNRAAMPHTVIAANVIDCFWVRE